MMKAGSSLLHVGCGGDPLPEWAEDCIETRLDIDPSVKPDIVASMTDMGDIGQYDVIYCNHALEHLDSHDVEIALSEFKRVLQEGGYAFIVVPDLEDVKATDEVILQAPIGPITGKDMIYGLQNAIKDNPYMAHKTGFVKDTLQKVMEKIGFSKIEVRRLSNYNLLGVCVK